ncbi:nucleoside phosphorylase [Pyrobaculum ferrireducens]|uniref:nucleoside phosphorylase n=1 Tax=Pyrobaculum ferrireducens TaxID=1104324 RepID=UPI00202AA541|nr:hypothetical protein [Pyrobaculum ferrireducens]
MPYHIRAERGDVAPVVVGVGDPARARLFASLMEEARLVNEHRYPVYTGRVKGRRITVAAHGIGGPSAAIALEELKMLGMEIFVRIGTAGSFGGLEVGDVLVAAAAAAPAGGVLGAYFPGHSPPLAADPPSHCEAGPVPQGAGRLRGLQRRLLRRGPPLCRVLAGPGGRRG